MKKFLALTLALAMCLTLTACGGVDKQAAVDAHTALVEAYNELGALINENGTLVTPETASAVAEIADVLSAYTEELESADLTQERADEIVEELNGYTDLIAEYKALVEEEIAASAGTDGVEITPEQLQALTDAYNTVAPTFNEAYDTAEANGWLADETTVTELTALSASLSVIGEALSGDLSALAGSDFDELPGAVLGLSEGIDELMARVSVPYQG